MSAETLRRASALMRERAGAATPGPWTWREEHGRDFTDEGWSYVAVETARGDSPGQYGEEVAATAYPGDSDGGESQADATHIASWHPAVALAVAKAMDDVAHAWEICDDGWTRDMDDDPIRFEDTVDGGWLAVARAYLGEQS